jgi:DNA repair exonuclease SbcCD ATPase subunit
MNGDVFRGLKKLSTVNLKMNVCVNDEFFDQIKLPSIKISLKCEFDEPEISQTAIMQAASQVNDLEVSVSTSIIDKLEAEINSTKSQIALMQTKFTNETENLKAEIEKLKLHVVKAQPKFIDENLAMIEKLQSEWKFQEIFSNKLKEEVADLKTANYELKSEKIELKSFIKSDKQQCQNQLEFIRELHQKLETQWNVTCALENKDLRNNFESKLKENGELAEKLKQLKAENDDNKEEIKNLKRKIETLSGN